MRQEAGSFHLQTIMFDIDGQLMFNGMERRFKLFIIISIVSNPNLTYSRNKYKTDNTGIIALTKLLCFIIGVVAVVMLLCLQLIFYYLIVVHYNDTGYRFK